MLYTIVGMLVIILDQVVKYWVDKNITYDQPVREIISGVISLVRVENDGAAFSFLAGGGARIWFIVLTGIFALVVVLALVTNFISGRFGRWCLVMVTAGGLSNCIDRVLYGYVLDMFKVELFNFAVFNVADIFITVFAILFIIYILFGGEKELNESDEFDEEDDETKDRVKYTLKPKKERFIRAAEDDKSSVSEEVAPRANSVKKNSVNRDYNYATSDIKANNPSATTIKDKTSSREFEDFFAQHKKTEKSVEKTSKPNPFTALKKEAMAESEKPDVMPVQRKAENAAPVIEQDDPFAEWDKANKKSSSAYEAPKKENVPEVKAVPEVKPAEPKPVEKKSSSYDDFDLDSILNEFK